MRALLEDRAFATTQATEFTITEVGLSTAKRDVWFRIEKTGAVASFDIFVYKTRAAAQTGGATYIASAETEGVPPSSPISFTNNAANAPDMSGLVVKVSGDMDAADAFNVVWGYTCAPDLVALDNLEAIYEAQTTEGLSLEDFDATTIGVGDPGESAPEKYIALFTTDQDEGPAGVSKFRIHTFQLGTQIAATTMDDGTAAGVRENSWRICRQYQAAIQSITWDESRDLYGETYVPLYSGGHEGPDAAQDNHLLMVANVFSAAEFAMWRDDVYPRP